MAISALVTLIIYLVVAGLVYFVVQWFLSQCGLPEPFAKIANIVLALIVVLIVLYALMGLLNGGVGAPVLR